ncbi:hypothetical protein OS493_014215 [Desmophyllum pertusum]|uniref:BZIP domain-containing protein n=1 Tax=Desmophyllum pertusum TaxID=174260 RepID=A0A9W9Z0I7_9CNID|nr:hypothetical protein OS493_014215 [Desmophyllum pertusum]
MEKERQASENSSPTYEHDAATPSRFLDSFQGMFLPAFGGVPFVDRSRASTDYNLESDDEENQVDKKKRVRLLCDEILTSAKKNSFQVGSQLGNYIPSARRKDFGKEIAAFESEAQTVSSTDNGENKQREALSDEPAEKRRKDDSSEDDDSTNGTRERESYWERRKKNNASAKKSRDARKARELQTQIKAAFLERENLRILAQLMIVQQENACLKRVLCAKM